MSLVQTPADDPKMAAEEDHEVAAATKSGRPTAKDAALLAFVSSIGPFAANAYVPAFDEIGQHYGVGLVTVQQTLSIYLAAFACTSLLIGAASDAFGRKAVLALSMTVFAVSSLGLLFADSMEAFFIWRFVMGMAAAAGPVVTQAIVRDRWSGGDFVLNVMGLGVDEFGWLMIPMVVAGMTGSWACSHLLAMFGQNRLLFWGVGFLAASGLFGVVFDHGPFAVFPWVLLAPVVYNFAAAAVRPALNVMNLDYFPKSRGLAASVQQFFQTGAFAVSSALLIPIVLGEAWKYAAVMLGSGLIALVLLLVVRRTRPAALAAAEAEELAEDELRIKPTKLS